MAETYGDNLVFRNAIRRSLAAQPELKERLEAAAVAADLPMINRRPGGLEFSNRYRAIAERLIDSPDLNHERGQLYLDLSPTNAAS